MSKRLIFILVLLLVLLFPITLILEIILISELAYEIMMWDTHNTAERVSEDASRIEEIFEQAEETKDYTICDQAGVFTGRCYNHLARILNDPSLCREISGGETHRGTCGAGPGSYEYTYMPYCSIYTTYGGYDDGLGVCVAEASNYSTEECMKISSDVERNDCLYEIERKERYSSYNR